MKMKFRKVLVAGLGEVGLPTVDYIKSRGLAAFGYDINESAVLKAKSKGIWATTDFDDLPTDIDAYIICVSTLLSDNDVPDMTSVFDVCDKIARNNCRQCLVSIESTIIPGTSRKIYRELFNECENIFLVHVPHRYWSGDPINYGVRQLRVLGAINDESLKRGLMFYRDILDIPLYVVSSIEIAEMCKIAENAYRYVCIAFAEELCMICEDLGLNFHEVREACNTKWNIHILEARDGIGGHCLPKDTKYLASLSSHNLILKCAMEVDKQYRKWLRRKVEF